MRKQWSALFVLLALFVQPLFAQITFTADDLRATFNQTVETSFFQATSLTGAKALADQAGAGQTWDFSTLAWAANGSGSSSLISPVPSGLPGAGSFPNANVVGVVDAGSDSTSWVYYVLTDADFSDVGFVGRGEDGTEFTIVYSQPLRSYVFPMTYQSQWEGQTTYQGDFGIPVTIQQGRKVVVDGYGTLVTPAGSAPALRLKMEQSISIVGFPVPPTVVYIYSWITKGGLTANVSVDATGNVLSAGYEVRGGGGGNPTAPESAPSGLTPADGAEGLPTTMQVGWDNLDGASSYDLEVATDVGFSALVVDEEQIAGPTRTVGVLDEGTTYFWRVRGRNAAGPGPWSAASRFTTVTTAPGSAPSLASPSDGAEGQSTTPQLRWNDVDGASSYDLQVATDAGFSAIDIEENQLAGPTRIVGPLTAGTTYFWRVRGRNAGGTGPWSEAWRFTVQSSTNVEPGEGVPAAFALHGSYPNPFNPSAEIAFDVPHPAAVRLAVYDASGRLVRVLADRTMPAGAHRVAFDAAGLPSGLYLYRLSSGTFTASRTMMLVR